MKATPCFVPLLLALASALHSPYAAGPLAFGPVALPEGTFSPTCDKAFDTTCWAGAGSEPVAAAAVPAVRAMAGMAIPRALTVSNFDIGCRLSTSWAIGTSEIRRMVAAIAPTCPALLASVLPPAARTAPRRAATWP